MTPRELFLIVDDYNAKRESQRIEAMTTAYLSAYWQRVKRLPPLKKVLEDLKPKDRSEQKPEDMLAAVKRMQSQFERGEG